MNACATETSHPFQDGVRPMPENLTGSSQRRRLIGLFYGFMSLLIWEFLVRGFEIRPTVLPSPSRVVLELYRQSAPILNHARVTSSESLVGLSLAALAGFTLAAIASRLDGAGRMLAALLIPLQSLPWLALAPLLAIWLGFGDAPATALAFLVCLFPLASGMRDGLQSLPQETLDIMKTMGAGTVKTFLHVQLPAGLPFLAVALHRAIPLAFGGAVVAEFVSSDRGLGYLLMYAGARGNMAYLIAVLVMLGFLVLGCQTLLSFLVIARIDWRVHPPGRPVTGAMHRQQTLPHDRSSGGS